VKVSPAAAHSRSAGSGSRGTLGLSTLVMISQMLSVATWNLRFNSRPARTLEYLRRARWDVVCLQEVSEAMSAALKEQAEWAVVDGLKLARNQLLDRKRPHAAAIIARHGWRLHTPAVVSDTPTPGRGVIATASSQAQNTTIISWHAPNAAGEGVVTKMTGYRALLAAIATIDGPLVVGMDSNHWSRETSLDLADHDPKHPFAVEHQFFGRSPQHRLRDALRVFLLEHPDAYAKLVAVRPNGPLEVTYKRGRTLDRFDYLMISDEYFVRDITHDYNGAREAGSDHGLVSADLAAASEA
jgi:endonuclease/exonuclease/phosphatase family metal-dependent hydrolase